MRKVVTSLLLIIILIMAVSETAFALKHIQADGVVLMEAQTGQIIYQQNADIQLPPASTTKILTGILAIEKGNMYDLFTASKLAVNDIGKDGMNIGIMEGEKIPLEDLVNALLVRSANETANIIAENMAGSEKEFVEWMNTKAREIGAVNSVFVNPCGKDSDRGDEGHISTAKDMALITRYAMRDPKFREIVAKKVCVIAPTNKHSKEVFLATTNKLLYPAYKSDLFTVTGVKTGFTNKAGFNLVSAGRNFDGMEMIAVVMGVKNNSSSSVYTYSKALLEEGYKTYKIQTIAPKNQLIKASIINDGKAEHQVNIVTEKEFKSPLAIDNSLWKITTKEKYKALTVPVKKGNIVGSQEYYNNGILLGKINLVAANTVHAYTAPPLYMSIISVALKITSVIIVIFATLIIWLRWSGKSKKTRRTRSFKRQITGEI